MLCCFVTKQGMVMWHNWHKPQIKYRPTQFTAAAAAAHYSPVPSQPERWVFASQEGSESLSWARRSQSFSSWCALLLPSPPPHRPHNYPTPTLTVSSRSLLLRCNRFHLLVQPAGRKSWSGTKDSEGRLRVRKWRMRRRRIYGKFVLIVFFFFPGEQRIARGAGQLTS